MPSLSPIPHRDLLALLCQIGVLLFAARALGELAQRRGQPAVVGELLAGILLGPSALGALFPDLKAWIVPQNQVQGHLLEVVSLMGAIFLLLITGLETDLRLIKRQLKTGVGVSLGALILPFASGYLLGRWLPESLLVNPSEREVFSLFLATAMSISAIPVIAKVLIDLNLMRREIGQTVIAAGMCDDTIGWVLLSIVTGLAKGSGFSWLNVAKSFGTVLFFIALSFTVGRWLVKKGLFAVQNFAISSNKILSFTLILTFAWAALTMSLKLEAVFGAFVMGILLGQMREMSGEVHRKLESLTLGFFAPVFFAAAGLKVNVTHLIEPELLAVCGVVIAIACGGKILGAYWGARLIGKTDRWTALSYGAGMNARGAMEIIIATIGLSYGILSEDMFSIIVVMAMVTSLMAPTMLRWTIRHITPSEQETRRLAEEERVRGSLVAGIRRILMPVRYKQSGDNPIHTLEAKILDMMGRDVKLSITLFSVAARDKRAQYQDYLNRLTPLFPRHDVTAKVVESDHLADVILDEAHRGYDLIVLGAPEQNESTDILFTPLVDYLVRAAPCPTLIVKSHHWSDNWSPEKILIPTNGSEASKNAAELGFRIAARERKAVVLNAVVHETGHWRYSNETEMLRRELGISRHIVEDLTKLGSTLGVDAASEILVGANPESVILKYAETNAVDLIVIGTNLRPGSERLFLGPRVERILNNADCPVIVINSA